MLEASEEAGISLAPSITSYWQESAEESRKPKSIFLNDDFEISFLFYFCALLSPLVPEHNQVSTE